jgi:hypothetical protein
MALKMTNPKILIKAIEKAEKCGFEISEFEYDHVTYHGYTESIIFSHDFAKAFWGEKKVFIGTEKVPEPHTLNVYYDREVYAPSAWQYHLQQLVLAEDRLKYLEEFLDEKEIYGKVKR